MARPFQHPAEADVTLDAVLHALSDGTRRAIVARLIAHGAMNCAQSCDALPPSTISHHHRILRDSGLILSERRGVAVINSVRRDLIERRFPGLLSAILPAAAPPPSRSPLP